MEKRLKGLKQMAKEKIKEEKYTEAFLHLTNALKYESCLLNTTWSCDYSKM